jgi:integrase
VSIYKTSAGTYAVRYREGGKQREKRFTRKGDAERWDTDRKRRRDLGPRMAADVLDRDDALTLAQFIEREWAAYAPTDPSSRAKYAWALERHCAELLDEPLVIITAPVLAQHQLRMRDRGASANTRREVFMYLARVLQVAVMHGRLTGNPARGLPKLDRHVRAEKQALTPRELEAVLAGMTGRDKAITILGGRLGLRPAEIVLARWDMLVDGELHIGARDTKRSAAKFRAIPLDRYTAQELRVWQVESGGRGRDLIVGEMTANALKLWGTKRLRPRVLTVTQGRIPKASTNMLRHSHASALHYASFTLPEAAGRMGHTQQTHILHYAHILAMTRSERYANLDDLYGAARNSTDTQHQVRAAAPGCETS